jgi:putative ABC transport system permease protein
MFKNYLNTAWRNIVRQKVSTFINISGLTLGISCSLVLFLMVEYLSSFDNYHTNLDRIYRVVSKSQGNQGTDFYYGVPAVFTDAFRTDFPEAEAVVFTSYRDNDLVVIPQGDNPSKKFQEERGIVYTDPNFFKIFDRKVLEGDATKALANPNEAVISKSWAKRYFGKDDVIGEILQFEDKQFKVSAVMEDAPTNTDLPFELMLSYITVKKQREDNGWNSTWSNEQCYFLLKENVNPSAVESRLPAFGTKYLGEDDFDKTEFMLQPLSTIHSDDRFEGYTYNTVPKEMIITFWIIAIALIVTACINFINLSTAEAVKRSKEVGVRKSLGSTRGQLVRQFLGETTAITLVSVLAAIAFSQMILSFLNPFLEMHLKMDFGNDVSLWVFLLSVTFGVSLLSGLYPAFVISSYKPALVLKNQMADKSSSSYILRQVLVVGQFWISQLLIIGTLVIVYQMNYSSEKDLGFAKEAIIFTEIPEEEAPQKDATSGSKMRTLREQMASISGVKSVSLSSAPPSSGNVSGTNFKLEGVAEDHSTQLKQIDGNYVDLYELQLVAGRKLDDNDTISGFMVNEKLVQTVGLKSADEIIGKQLTLWGKTFPVVGVVKDFHTVSLREPIEAIVLFNRIRGFSTLSLKVEMGNSKNVIDQLKTNWEATYPEHLFDYQFLDENIREFYDGERKMSVLLSVFTTMAIFIGCLGLFGLASFMANQKNKEIGVRKVLGASVESIIFMFSKQYFKLIVIGFLLAAPMAWFAMSSFLNQFAYKIDLTPGIFLSGFFVTMIIAMITVGYKSFTAAVRNPVHALRSE